MLLNEDFIQSCVQGEAIHGHATSFILDWLAADEKGG